MKQELLAWPQVKYLANELNRKRSASDLDSFTETLHDAKVDLNPHQVESAFFAFQSPLSNGAILADEVGLGKTIEAGIILSQKWAERKRCLLVITPANLRKQWVDELEDKFYLPAIVLDSKALKSPDSQKYSNPFERDTIVVCSYEFARRQASYIKSAKFDLVVMDEAHRVRNVYRKDNQTGNILRDALEGKRKLLLTATPLQNNLLELYGLASFIDPYAFGDLKSFKARYSGQLTDVDYNQLKSRLAPLCHRTLRRQVLQYIRYTKRIPILQEFVPSEEEALLYDLVTEFLQRPELYSIRASQRTLTTLVLRKLLASSSYAISGTLSTLIDRIDLKLEEQRIEDAENSMSDYEGIELLQEELPDLDDDLISSPQMLSEEEVEKLQDERSFLARCRDLAKSIRTNSKAEQLFVALKKGFEQLSSIGANRKALIFTESRRTQEFLYDLLTKRGYEGEVMTFNGSNNDPRSTQILNSWKDKYADTDKVTGVRDADMRAALVDYFRNNATIMIATEAAAEGINLQFCSLVVNYDLPWNPQRIEQRIGRCHRYGQKYDVVVINFLNKTNAADRRVYELLDEKFQLFDGVFGASDEVLGSISSGTDFEQRIAQIYQTCRTEEEIQAAFDKLNADLSPQIDEKMRKARVTLLEHFDDDVRLRLKDSQDRSRQLLQEYEQKLWWLTRYVLKDVATFSDQNYSFTLHHDIPDVAHAGKYVMLETDRRGTEGDTLQHAMLYRAHHPLAKYVMKRALDLESSPCEVWDIHYTTSGRAITPVAELVGQRGYISVDLLRLDTAETVEHLVTAMITSDGEVIPDEVVSRLWTLPSSTDLYDQLVPPTFSPKLQSIKDEKCGELGTDAKTDAYKLFDTEMTKLDTWADDMKLGLDKELKDLDQTIRLRKSEARKSDSVEERLLVEREITDLQRQLKRKRSELFEAYDQIDEQKESLLDDLEKLRDLHSLRTTLFTIPWRID